MVVSSAVASADTMTATAPISGRRAPGASRNTNSKSGVGDHVPFSKQATTNCSSSRSASPSSDVGTSEAEDRLLAVFDEVLTEVEPRAKAVAARNLGPESTSMQIKRNVETAYDSLAESALRYAYAHGVTGRAALEAVSGFLARLRERLENYLATLVAGYLAGSARPLLP